MKNGILSPPRYVQKSGAAPQLYTPFVLRTLVDSKLRVPVVREKEKRLILCCIWHEMTFSLLWTGALVETGRKQAKRVVRNEKKDTTTLPLSWTADANTVVGVLVVSGSHRKCFFYASDISHSLYSFRTFPIRSGLLASVHSFAIDDTGGIFLWRSRHRSVEPIKRKWWWWEVFLCIYVIRLARYGRVKLVAGLVIQSQQLAVGFRPATRRRSFQGSLWYG
ncbi:hypothetical protein M9H77_23641 [Catharanthus roseus]|uniref:Uncharacterized protein n=1 Tax=Catharanthus roseus TaxID=4058 RepID=A0ACC0ATL4_CATRO|nr:hypothetical protein M9H77_23641 [Catharanthus roseus]